MDDAIRELLDRKADEITRHREVPRPLLRRVRRRIALNALAVATALGVAGAGAFVGVQALRDAGNPKPVVPAESPSVRPTPSVRTTPSDSTRACTSGQLRAVGTLEGAAGSREGSIDLTNFSDQPCRVRGRPTITLLDENLDPITSGVTFMPSPPQWAADGSPKPPGWPDVTLAPGDSASIRIRWSNWCPDGRAAPLWRIEMRDGGTVDVFGLDDGVGPPPCNGPGQPSTIEEGPFEPSSGA